jgi:ribosomal protein S15P/S13E
LLFKVRRRRKLLDQLKRESPKRYQLIIAQLGIRK